MRRSQHRRWTKSATCLKSERALPRWGLTATSQDGCVTTGRELSSRRPPPNVACRTTGVALDQSCAAVTVKDRASREFIADKEQDGLSNVTRCTNAADRNARG